MLTYWILLDSLNLARTRTEWERAAEAFNAFVEHTGHNPDAVRV